MSDTIEADMRRLDYGWDGFKVLSAGESVDTTMNQDGFYAIKAVSGGTNISASAYRGDSISNMDMVTGDVILGLFGSVTCNSGKILVYMR